MKTRIPEEMCSGSCGGKKENCPVPMACGWPEDINEENKILNHLIGILVCVGLIVFCVGVIVWL
jgi:hypothetical protein